MGCTDIEKETQVFCNDKDGVREYKVVRGFVYAVCKNGDSTGID